MGGFLGRRLSLLNICTREVKASRYAQRRRGELLDFMNDLLAENTGKEVHDIQDNLNTHKPKRDRWLKLHPQFPGPALARL